MALVPHRFLFRMAYRCPYLKGLPRENEERLLDLPAACRIDNFASLDERRNFADLRLAWNDFGLAVQVEVSGKDQLPRADAAKPRHSDGLALWLDTRDARASHRATRYCHQFHFLPTGGGPDHDEPAFVQVKIHRALHDAPLAPTHAVLFRGQSRQTGYLLEAFLTSAALHGFDPEQTRRLGFYYSVKDAELGEQVLSVGGEFPFWEDPSLWSVLELVR
ncbi:MAG: hypothetical protein ACK4RK_04465 [Gemmataceae bacterium]